MFCCNHPHFKKLRLSSLLGNVNCCVTIRFTAARGRNFPLWGLHFLESSLDRKEYLFYFNTFNEKAPRDDERTSAQEIQPYSEIMTCVMYDK